jgi:hypothetical protein
MKIHSFRGFAQAHVPEHVDPTEPMVRLLYVYRAGLARSEHGDAELPSVELLAAIHDGRDILPEASDDLYQVWLEVAGHAATARIVGE